MLNTKKILNDKSADKIRDIVEKSPLDIIMGKMAEMEKRLDKAETKNVENANIILGKDNVIKELKRTQSKQTTNVAIDENKLSLDDDVLVTNLCTGELVLSTNGFGEGKAYTFNGFGYQREIPYGDLKEIIHANRSFIEGGMIYIEDIRCIKKFKLQNYYDKMMSCGEIKELHNLKAKEIFNKLISLPKAESNTLNIGNEPCQFDIVFDYVRSKYNENLYSDEQIYQIEKAYEVTTGKKYNFEEEFNFFKEVMVSPKE